MHYENRLKEKSLRIILPLRLFHKNRMLYLKTFCYLRNEERTFRVSIISKIEKSNLR